MNPVENYRDASLDGLVTSRSRSQRSSSARQYGNDPNMRAYDAFPQNLPPAPDVPRDPPVSFRGVGSKPEVGGVQRSFSQRARGRPFADEAFAYDDVPEPPAATTRRQTSNPTRSNPASAVPLQVDTSPSTTRKQRVIQNNIRSAAEAASQPRDRSSRMSQPQSATYNEPMSGVSRSATLRDAANQTEEHPRDWAPDRSPLQKLEVTLNDISKEEKRARVQEAEMILREKSRSKNASQRPQPAQQPQSDTRQAVKSDKGPSAIQDTGIVRNLSSTHRDRLQHSTTIESRRPDARRLSGDKRGFDYEQQGQLQRETSAAKRSPAAVPVKTNYAAASAAPQRTVSNPQARQIRQLEVKGEPARSISASHRPNSSVPRDNQTLSIHRRSVQPRHPDDDRLPTAQERNASHKAALEQLTGVGPNATSPRTETRRQKQALQASQKNRVREPELEAKPVATATAAAAATTTNYLSTQRNTAINGQRPAPAPPQLHTPPPMPIPTHVQESPGMRSIDSSAPSETPRQRQRKSSVSFKEPFDRRRPVDEWKQAQTARLTANDFETQPAEAAEKYQAWWEEDSTSRRRRSSKTKANATAAAAADAAIDNRTAEFLPPLYLKCGPLLRYTGLKRGAVEGSGSGEKEFWKGTVMIVTKDAQSDYKEPPSLRLFSHPKKILPPAKELRENEELGPEYVDPIAGLTKVSRIGRAVYIRPIEDLDQSKDLSRIESDDGLFETSPRPVDGAHDDATTMAIINNRDNGDNGERLGRYQEIKGVRLYADPDNDVTFWLFKLEIELGPQQQHIGYRINKGASSGFWVPPKGETMNIMFHSCNGFSASVDADKLSGPDPLWRNVLDNHQSSPFHVMIGGGDQIYNDRVMTETKHFGEWTRNKNPHLKHHAPLTPEMKQELENFYLERYCMWFSQGLFGVANASIPMVNIWDDHDIIDGFGSYPDPFMKSPVFSGVGNIAFKYYMLFQHQSVDAMTSADEPSWILGYKPGPYIHQLSRSLYLEFGKSVAFLGLDCRTERMKDEVLTVDSCDIALDRCRKEIVEGQTKHLLVLLGVPIAYPRLNWLENVLTSRAMDPIKAMGRYGMVKGGFLNKFDGGVEILDDLDDHWTASHHKRERNDFIKELQDLAAERSVRITILSGDVHLAAIGQFYSNPKLRIPKDRDHRYMPNVISSAIVNTPPPEMMADVLNKRNKVHHLDEYTDESMIPMFSHDVDMKKRNNKHLLPRRNWCSITQYAPGKTPPSSRSTTPSLTESELSGDEAIQAPTPKRKFSLSRDDINPRMLIRRLSTKNAPPSSYRDMMQPNPDTPVRSASFDGTTRDRGMLGWGTSQKRSASETRHESTDRSSSLDQTNPRARPPLRPGFHRLPTNLSKKAAKKGEVPAIDADGNEFDVNDHINLEGGLDIILNCEQDHKDPSGITTPYRLLVPALWYDGTSDIEKLPGAGLQRKPTLMNRIGFGGKRSHKAAQNQGAGNWGQESDSASYTGSEESYEEEEPLPRKTFGGFLGSLRKRRDPDQISHEQADHDMPENKLPPATSQPHGPLSVAAPVSGHVPSATAAGDMLYDTTNRPTGSTAAAFNRPPKQASLPRDVEQQQSTANPSAYTTPVGISRNISAPIPIPHPVASVPTQNRAALPREASVNRSNSRPKSYVIGSHPVPVTSGSGQPNGPAQSPYDADSAYIRQHQSRGATLSPQAPPSSFPTQTFSPPPVSAGTRSQGSMDLPRGSDSRQEQVPGLGTDRDSGFQGNPQQRSLRGNGIIGNFFPRRSSSARRADAKESPFGPGRHAVSSQSYNQDPSAGKGYSGIEAYRETPKRRFSLRDKARDLMDKVEGRRKYDDDEYDSYSGSESGSYTDEEQNVRTNQVSQPQQTNSHFSHQGGRKLPQQQAQQQYLEAIPPQQQPIPQRQASAGRRTHY